MVTLLLLACATATDAPVDTGDSADSAEVGDSADAAETGDSADTGPDPANQDADGDGYTPAEGDCDDTRDSVYPGAPDYCDGIDGDCDGEAIPDGACAVAGDIGAMSSWWIESSDELQPWSIRAGDVSGDGVPDLVTLGGPEGGGESFIVVDTTPLSERPAVSSWVAPSYTDGWPAFSMPQGETLVDSTGDGIADIWVSTSAQNGFLGSLFLFPGRTDGFPTEPTRLDAGAQAWWHDDGALWGQQFMPGGVGDLTGDGRADVLVSVQSDTDEYMARVEGGAELSGEHTWSEVSRMNFDGLYGAHLFSDLDGDGLDEISLETNDGSNDAAFVSGADWSADGHAGDVYTRLRDASAAGQQVYDTLTRDRTDDIDGDGLNDAILASASPDWDRRALVLTGGIPTGDVADWTFARICGTSNAAEPRQWTDDIDDDGVRDFLTGSGEVVPSTQLRSGGSFTIDDIVGPAVDWRAGLQDVIDLDGDGRPEWLYSDSYDAGNTYIIAGFDLPWDDPTKW